MSAEIAERASRTDGNRKQIDFLFFRQRFQSAVDIADGKG